MELRAYLEGKHGGRVGIVIIRKFAEETRHSIFAVRKWLTRERAPRPHTQALIKRLTAGAVGAEDWWPAIEPEKKKKGKKKPKKNGS